MLKNVKVEERSSFDFWDNPEDMKWDEVEE